MTICTVIIPVSAYADNYYISGVDISEHNDNVNLSALKAQGFLFILHPRYAIPGASLSPFLQRSSSTLTKE